MLPGSPATHEPDRVSWSTPSSRLDEGSGPGSFGGDDVPPPIARESLRGVLPTCCARRWSSLSRPQRKLIRALIGVVASCAWCCVMAAILMAFETPAERARGRKAALEHDRAAEARQHAPDGRR